MSPSPTGAPLVADIRRRQRQGIALSPEERRVLAEYFRRYSKQKLSIHLKADRAREWQQHAEAKGLSLGKWIQERVLEALRGHEDALRDLRTKNEALQAEVTSLTSYSARLGVEKAELEARIIQHEAALQAALKLTARVESGGA